MADNNSGSEKIENELTVGNFAAVQARTLAFQVGGVVIGWAAAKYGLAKTGLAKKIAEWTTKEGASAEHLAHNIENVKRTWLPMGGALVGSIIGGIASMYEHWVKAERERLGVQEINKDVATIMEKRVQFEETLDKQHGIVKDLLAKHEAGGHVAAVEKREPVTPKSIIEEREGKADMSKAEKVIAAKEAGTSEHALGA